MNIGNFAWRALCGGAALAFSAGIFSETVIAADSRPSSGQGPKWGSHIDLEAKWGNRRSLGDIGLFAPLWQDRNSIFFTDLRARFDNDEGREGNFGFGYRHMNPNGWNPGVYGYYDARRSPSGNVFQQLTLGAEMLSADFDLRANLYIPFGKREYVIGGGAGGAPFAQFAGGTIQIVTPGGQLVERSLRGVDAEIGWRLPVFPLQSMTQLRAYAGAFWFDGENLMSDIAGPRGRLELSFDNLPYLNEGSRFTLGLETQHDNVRGTNNFVLARLRIPLQPVKHASTQLTPQERRMTERVVRDVDIVTGNAQKGSGTPTVEDAINRYNNLTVTSAAQVDGADGFASVQNAINNGAAGRVVILNGNLNSAAAQLFVVAGRTLIGGGTALPLQGATTNVLVDFVAPGAAGGVTSTANGGLAAIAMSGNSVVGGLTVQNTSVNNQAYGLFAFASSGVTAFNNAVTTAGTNSPGILLELANNATARGNTVQTTGAGSNGIHVENSTGVTIANNTFGPSIAGIDFNSVLATYVTANSTGNIDNSAAVRCNVNAASNGTVSFTNAPNCVYP